MTTLFSRIQDANTRLLLGCSGDIIRDLCDLLVKWCARGGKVELRRLEIRIVGAFDRFVCKYYIFEKVRSPLAYYAVRIGIFTLVLAFF